MNKRRIGKEYEEIAVSYLEKHGYQILETNYWCREGEIDIIGSCEGCLCFVEVKYRGSSRYGYPEEAVDIRKQRTIIRTAEYYLKRKRISFDLPCRFDVIAIDREEIRLLKNAYTL